MDLRHLRYFRTIGREEHFGRAAIQLRVAQPALTRQIKDLEAELGVELFERLPRGVRLSAAGQVFLQDAEDILDQVDRAVDRVRRLASGHLGTIRVGLSEIISGHGFISYGLLKFRESEPDVALDLKSMSSMQQVMALKDGQIDAGIVYGAHVDERDAALLDFARIGIGRTMLAVHAGHRLAGRDAVTMAELIEEPALWPARRIAPGYYDKLTAACAAAGGVPKVVQECNTNSILLSLVAVGMGIGFVTVSPPLATFHNIRLVPIVDLDLSFDVILVWRRSDRSAAVRRFVDMMTAQEEQRTTG